jgi:hypothetical protein
MSWANSCGSDAIGTRSSPDRRYAFSGNVEMDWASSRFAAYTDASDRARVDEIDPVQSSGGTMLNGTDSTHGRVVIVRTSSPVFSGRPNTERQPTVTSSPNACHQVVVTGICHP